MAGASEKVFYSGGAKGADFEWAQAAAQAGYAVSIASFKGHAAVYPNNDNIRRRAFTPLALNTTLAMLRTAAKSLRKPVPAVKGYVFELLARNCVIASKADVMLAVGKLVPNAHMVGHVGVDGGTGWTCQVFAMKCYSKMQAADEMAIPLYLFEDRWYQCYVNKDQMYTWKPMDGKPALPEDSSVCAGIGSRVITAAQIIAIRSVFPLSAMQAIVQ